MKRASLAKRTVARTLKNVKKIAVEGCCHGELDLIYKEVRRLEQQQKSKVDLVLICGDFQAVRNEMDLECMAVPVKYRRVGTFWKYYTGKAVAPYPTIFIGGNHEASNYLWELYHGGWVCPNIYFLGYAGVVNFKGVRIGGLSGIYKDHHYLWGHHEKVPYDSNALRSIYHVRKYDVEKLMQIRQPLDVFVSHDWPRGIEQKGNLQQLLNAKPHFAKDVNDGVLGSPASAQLLEKLRPAKWFSAHLHVHYRALVEHEKSSDDAQEKTKTTEFISLDKCLPRRRYLQIVDIPTSDDKNNKFQYDLEWLAITRAMHPYLSTERNANTLPSEKELQKAIEQELMYLQMEVDMGNLDLEIPNNFDMTAPAFDPAKIKNKQEIYCNLRAYANPQTTAFCNLIGVEDKISASLNKSPPESSSQQPADLEATTSPADATADRPDKRLKTEHEQATSE